MFFCCHNLDLPSEQDTLWGQEMACITRKRNCLHQRRYHQLDNCYSLRLHMLTPLFQIFLNWNTAMVTALVNKSVAHFFAMTNSIVSIDRMRPIAENWNGYPSSEEAYDLMLEYSYIISEFIRAEATKTHKISTWLNKNMGFNTWWRNSKIYKMWPYHVQISSPWWVSVWEWKLGWPLQHHRYTGTKLSKHSTRLY